MKTKPAKRQTKAPQDTIAIDTTQTIFSSDLGQPAIWEWTPGTTPRRYPPGVGKRLKSGCDLVLFIHYHPSGKPETDRTRIGLYFSRTPVRQSFHWHYAVGVNRELIQDGVNGFLAATDQEWVEKLGCLLASGELRRRFGDAGRRTVDERYSLRVNAPMLAATLGGVVERSRRK